MSKNWAYPHDICAEHRLEDPEEHADHVQDPDETILREN